MKKTADRADTNRHAPVVEIRKLTKVFRDFWRRPKVRAVDGVDLDIVPGEIFGLLGPNGSGKTTTLKILLGLLFPTSGSLLVFNHSPRDVQTKSRIGYLPEESYLYKYLTPRETLDFYGKLFNIGPRERRRRIDELLEMVDLTDAAHRVVGEFSKGMARRVGLAQALINDPELVILDEPTSGLDPIGCRQVKDLMLALAQRGKTIILSSHLLADVEDVCDRISILYKGKVRAQGRVRELLREQHRVRIDTPSLPPETMTQVLSLIREKIGIEPDVDHPAMDLERFFLQVVREAHGGAAAENGSAGRGKLANYLSGTND